jgi:hypothetical protein
MDGNMEVFAEFRTRYARGAGLPFGFGCRSASVVFLLSFGCLSSIWIFVDLKMACAESVEELNIND